LAGQSAEAEFGLIRKDEGEIRSDRSIYEFESELEVSEAGKAWAGVDGGMSER
jgi:hypothetical protein